MNDKSDKDYKVQCKICLREIPKSEAKSAEAVDYVAYFCGLDCYQQWQEQGQPPVADSEE